MLDAAPSWTMMWVYVRVCVYVCVWESVCMCMCVYIYIYACICIYTYIHTSVYILTCMYTCSCIYVYINVYIYVYIYIYIYIYKYIYIYIYTYIYIYINKSVLTHIPPRRSLIASPSSRGSRPFTEILKTQCPSTFTAWNHNRAHFWEFVPWCARQLASSPRSKFSKVGSLLNALYKMIVELTFENYYLGALGS